MLPLLIGGAILGDQLLNDGDATKKVGDTIFGSSTDPGILGLSKQKVNQHAIDPNNFRDPNAAADRADLQQRRAATDNRAAPQMQGTQVQNAGQAGLYQAGNVERAGGATLGANARSNTANITRDDQEGRGYQSGVMSSLASQAAGQGVGQDLAKQSYERANEASLQQAMALAASRRGNRSNSLATIRDSVAADRQTNAAGLSADRMKAQMTAQEALAGVAGQQRSADIGVATSQAGLLDAANARNQTGADNFALSRFGATNDLNKFNATSQNANQQFNAGLGADTAKFNTAQANDMSKLQSQMDFQTQQANLEAYLKNQGMNDDMAKSYSQQILNQSEAQRQAAMDYEHTLVAQETQMGKLDQAAYEATAKRRGDAVSGVMSAIGGLASDVRVKRDITPVSSWIFGGQ